MKKGTKSQRPIIIGVPRSVHSGIGNQSSTKGEIKWLSAISLKLVSIKKN